MSRDLDGAVPSFIQRGVQFYEVSEQLSLQPRHRDRGMLSNDVWTLALIKLPENEIQVPSANVVPDVVGIRKDEIFISLDFWLR